MVAETIGVGGRETEEGREVKGYMVCGGKKKKIKRHKDGKQRLLEKMQESVGARRPKRGKKENLPTKKRTKRHLKDNAIGVKKE